MYRDKTGLRGLIHASLLMAASTTVSALQFNGDVGVDARYTDNAGLSPSNEKDELITTARIAAAVTENEGPLTGNASATLRQLDYLDNTFGDQTYFGLGSAFTWVQLDNRLVWSVNDYFSQTSINNLAANTPDNTENANAFSLAAAATIPVADRHRITVAPSFRDFYYETSGNDNQQLGLAAGWAYQLKPAISLSLNGSFSDVDFENTSSSDYERKNANIAVAVTRARSRYNATIGATEVKQDSGTKTDGVTGSVSWEHDLTGRSSFIAYVSSDITDTSNIFLSSSINPNTGSINNVQVSSDIVRNSVFRIAYRRDGATINSGIWAELRDLDYETAMLDREVQEIGTNISYLISPLVTGSVDGRFVRTDEKATPSIDNEFHVTGRLIYSLSRKLRANAGLQVQTKDSTNVPGREYDELSVFAGFSYLLGR